MYFRIIAFLLATISLGACEGPQSGLLTMPLAQDARGKLGSIEVVVAQYQSPIDASSAPTPGMGLIGGFASGLSGALQRERIELVNKALATFNYGDDTLQATQQAFAGIVGPRIRVSPTVARSPEEWRAAYKASTADAVLFFYIHYSIAGDQRPLQFNGMLMLLSRSAALRKSEPDPQADSKDSDVIFRSNKGVTRYFMGADSPTRVRSEYHAAARELAAWAATEAAALLK